MKLNDAEIEKFRHDLAYLRAAGEQFLRDCWRSGFAIEMDTNSITSFEHLQLLIQPFIKEWCKHSPHGLSVLMYQIDVPEHMLPEEGACKNIAHLSSLILQRELIKVIIRKQFST